MKIAIPVTGNKRIDDHFGHCEFYEIYTISHQNEIVEVKTIKSEQGCGCKSNIASTLAIDGVSVMLAGGIGGGAINVLNHAGIEVIRGCSGDARNVVEEFIKGELVDSGESCQHHKTHHQQGEGHGHICHN